MVFVASIALLSCVASPDFSDKGSDSTPDSGSSPLDADKDGFSGEEDCDDEDPEVWEGAPETCDDADNDCDGTVDEEAGEAWYADADEDGHGDPDQSQVACEPPEGFTASDTDCDDTDAAVNPDATEVCDEDGVARDNDCDGLVDLDDDTLDPSTAGVWFADSDGDIFGDPETVLIACSQPEASTIDDTDCDDSDPTVYPGADEVCDGVDNDCDGTPDGDILFTAFTSTYIYQGFETLGHLQSEVANSPLLCTTSLTSTSVFSGPDTCGSGTSDIGYELEVLFFVTAETAGTWSFRLGPDWGFGGALFLDQVEIAQSTEDLWWSFSWDDPNEILEATAELAEGTHTFNAIGFEECCSGWSTLEYRSPATADWSDLTPEGLGLSCEP